MISPLIPAAIGAFIIIPTLIAGAYCDHVRRTFPKNLWSITGKVALLCTFFMYLLLAANREWGTIKAFLAISIILSLAFYIITLRYGSGGDYRALIYIAWVAPMLAFWTSIYSLVLGVIQVGISRLHGTSAPWAIGIAIAYIVVYIQFFLLS